METLALAIKIADLASDAGQAQEPINVRTQARRLLKDHPEVELSEREIAEALAEETAAAGVPSR